MTSLATRAEVIKLARELHVETAELAFLRESPPDAIRAFRRAVAKQLDAPHRPMFRRLAAASALLPNAIAVAIATNYFGPMLCGMVSTELGAECASKLVGQVPVGFLADAAPYIDPDAAAPILRELSIDMMIPTLQELLRRKDYVTLARFITSVTDDQLVEAIPLVESGEDLLMTVHRENAWAELVPVVAVMSPDNLALVANLEVWNEENLSAAIAATREHDLWGGLRPLVAAMDNDNLERLGNLPIAAEPDVQAAIGDLLG